MSVALLRLVPRVRRVVTAAAVLSCACATAGGSSQAPPLPDGTASHREAVLLPNSTVYEYRPNPDSYVGADVRGSVPDIWRALPAAFDALGLTVDGLDGDTRRVTAAPVRLRGRLGKTTLDTYLDCGRGPLGVDAAVTYDVVLRVTSEVQRVGDERSEVRTWVSASAKPNTVSGDPVPCATRGKLERRIADAAQHALDAR